MDLATAHLRALEKLQYQYGVETYNIGSGKGYTVLEIVSAFENTIGKKIPYSFVDRRKGDVPICYTNPSKARNDLNWTALRCLSEMSRDAWRWQSNNPFGYETSLLLSNKE